MTVVEGGIHLLDLWRYWFGDVEWVQAHYQHRPEDDVHDEADNPYSYSALFGFACGAIGTMTLSRLRKVYADHMDHQVLWTEGRAEISHEGVTAYHYNGPYPPPQRPPLGAVTETLYEGRGGDDTFVISRVFTQAIAEGRPELIRSPFGDAMNSLAAVIGANVSDELGGERVNLEELLRAEKYSAFQAKAIIASRGLQTMNFLIYPSLSPEELEQVRAVSTGAGDCQCIDRGRGAGRDSTGGGHVRQSDARPAGAGREPALAPDPDSRTGALHVSRTCRERGRGQQHGEDLQ